MLIKGGRIVLGVLDSIVELSQKETFDSARICGFPVDIDESSPRSIYMSVIPDHLKEDSKIREFFSLVDEDF